MTSDSSSPPIRVGIVGIEPKRSWSARAHVPALASSPQFKLQGLATTRAESAAAAAAELGVPRWFAGHEALVSDPEIDLVVVTVKAPSHRQVVIDAIEAGKSVFCEWPLGKNYGETRELHALAEARGVRGFVGLQARVAPVIAYLRELVRNGYVGEVLSTSMIGSGMNWGAVVAGANRYHLEKDNGATLTTIPFGHAVDALSYVLGEFTEVSALEAVRQPKATVQGSDEVLAKTAEDQLVVAGLLQGGAVASIHFRAGLSTGTNFLWEINGTEGDLQITSDGGMPQIFDLTLKGAKRASPLEVLEPPAAYRWSGAPLRGPAVNVALAYAAIAADLRSGGKSFADFSAAEQRHAFLRKVAEAAATGRRLTLPG